MELTTIEVTEGVIFFLVASVIAIYGKEANGWFFTFLFLLCVVVLFQSIFFLQGTNKTIATYVISSAMALVALSFYWIRK